MKNKIINITFASLLGASPVVLAEGDKHDDFLFTKQALASLKLNSLLTIDDTQFVFNDSLLNVDWDNFFSLHASAIEDKKELILHWAGYTSINPKVILALIEQQSGLLSNPNADIKNPLAGITDKLGFDAQVKDVVMKLSQRFYAYKQWQETQDTLKKRNQVTQTTSSTAATAALVSLFADSNKLASNSKNNRQTLTEFLAAFDRVFPSHTSQLQRSLNSVDQNNAKQLLAASFEMNLPWPSGYWYSGGAHSNTGSGYPYSSLDFNNGSGGWGANTPFVQAAHGGTVTRFSSCNIRVTHASGYSTNYYHMSNLQYSNGDYVQPGAWLGRYANNYNQALCEGGQSSGPHVHFTLLYNGQQVSLHNKYISEHRIDVGSSNYDTNCNRFYFERYGYRTCAWQPLYR